MRIFLCVLICCLSFSAHAQTRSQDFSATDLYALCTSPYDTDYGFCAGYVAGIAQAMLTQSVFDQRACGHGRVRGQQFADIFKLYVEANEAQKDQAAVAVIAQSLARAFPCHD